MPDQFDRHARSRWEYGSPPSRADQVKAAAAASAGEPRRPRSRKDRARWCGGHTGREHHPQILLRVTNPMPGVCGWQPRFTRSGHGFGYVAVWTCGHEERCTECGRRIRSTLNIRPQECPRWPRPDSERVAAQQQAAIAQGEYDIRRGRWASRVKARPPVTGRQGYRRGRPQ